MSAAPRGLFQELSLYRRPSFAGAFVGTSPVGIPSGFCVVRHAQCWAELPPLRRPIPAALTGVRHASVPGGSPHDRAWFPKQPDDDVALFDARQTRDVRMQPAQLRGRGRAIQRPKILPRLGPSSSALDWELDDSGMPPLPICRQPAAYATRSGVSSARAPLARMTAPKSEVGPRNSKTASSSPADCTPERLELGVPPYGVETVGLHDLLHHCVLDGCTVFRRNLPGAGRSPSPAWPDLGRAKVLQGDSDFHPPWSSALAAALVSSETDAGG